MISVRGWSAALCLVMVACGRTPFGIGGAAGADGDTGGFDGADDGPGGAEAGDGDRDDDGDDDDGDDGTSDTGEASCPNGPQVLDVWRYDGVAIENDGADLHRHSDGLLYMGGAAIEGTTKYVWIAAAQTDGVILWEALLQGTPSTNLGSLSSRLSEFESVGEQLVYVGTDFDEAPVGLFGAVDAARQLVAPHTSVPSAGYLGISAIPGSSDFLMVGRNSRRNEGMLVERRSRAGATWDLTTIEAEAYGEIAASAAMIGDDAAIVAGTSSDLPWIARFDLEAGAPVWTATTVETTFEVDNGVLWDVAADEDRAYAAGFVYQTKPQPIGFSSFGEVYVAAYDHDGALQWSWQRSSTTVRPGAAQALALGDDGSVFVVGDESESGSGPSMFIGAFSREGDVQWLLDDTTQPDFLNLVAVGVAPGEPGQLFVLANEYVELGVQRTALIEICY